MADIRKYWVFGAIFVVIVGAVTLVTVKKLKAESTDKKPLPEVMKRMQYYNQSLGVQCDFCHVPPAAGGNSRWGIDTPRKRTAKWMEDNMVSPLRTRGGDRIDCHTCHNPTGQQGQARFLPSSQ